MAGTTASEERTTVLIVEDEALIRYALRNLLSSAFPGLGILEAADGVRALELCAADNPQFVLMDVGLPDANGIELTRKLKALLPGLKVIVVSNCTGEPYVSDARAAGAQAYVVKDRLLADLIPAVAQALGVAAATHYQGTFT